MPFPTALKSLFSTFSVLSKYRVPTWQNRFGRCYTNLLPKNHVIIRGFSPWTASGFYPWGNVVSPRKRVAVGLCGWRHGKLVSNAAKRTVAPPNAKHSTLLQGCFFMFLFLIPFTIRQQHIIYAPRNFPLSPCNSSNSVFFERIKKRLLPFEVIAVAIFCVFLLYYITRD